MLVEQSGMDVAGVNQVGMGQGKGVDEEEWSRPGSNIGVTSGGGGRRGLRLGWRPRWQRQKCRKSKGRGWG